jgi:NAD(P)-dependent dehydrogenase (short-subunit alcohol dehydrogenase family)
MASKTIVIVGVGPGFGLSVARRFGREGFNVGLICRNKERGQHYAASLSKDGIAATASVGDVTDESSLVNAFRDIEQRFGAVEVLEYSPVNIPTDPAGWAPLQVTAMTPATVQNAFGVMALGAVTSVNQVLPGMLARKSGTILITTGVSAKIFMPMVGAWGMAGSAARNYALTLHEALKDQGIFVGTMCIGVGIKEGSPTGDPNMLAEKYFAMYRDRTPSEIFVKG